ncbi:unnamed protein product, partial [Allacma fusca]
MHFVGEPSLGKYGRDGVNEGHIYCFSSRSAILRFCVASYHNNEVKTKLVRISRAYVIIYGQKSTAKIAGKIIY